VKKNEGGGGRSLFTELCMGCKNDDGESLCLAPFFKIKYISLPHFFFLCVFQLLGESSCCWAKCHEVYKVVANWEFLNVGFWRWAGTTI
jgi:hypothetical protein